MLTVSIIRADDDRNSLTFQRCLLSPSSELMMTEIYLLFRDAYCLHHQSRWWQKFTYFSEMLTVSIIRADDRNSLNFQRCLFPPSSELMMTEIHLIFRDAYFLHLSVSIKLHEITSQKTTTHTLVTMRTWNLVNFTVGIIFLSLLAQSVQCMATGWATGRSRFDPRQRRKDFSSSLFPHRLWGPPSLLCNGYRGSFPRG
jgi:hypothetical protein